MGFSLGFSEDAIPGSLCAQTCIWEELGSLQNVQKEIS